MVDPERTSPVDSALRVEGSQARLDPDWLAALVGVGLVVVSASGRFGLFCAGGCSALVAIIVAAGRDAETISSTEKAALTASMS